MSSTDTTDAEPIEDAAAAVAEPIDDAAAVAEPIDDAAAAVPEPFDAERDYVSELQRYLQGRLKPSGAGGRKALWDYVSASTMIDGKPAFAEAIRVGDHVHTQSDFHSTRKYAKKVAAFHALNQLRK